MITNDDTSVTLTAKEFKELNECYQELYSIIADGPSFLGDYFDTRAEYLRVVKWSCLLNGQPFNQKDHV